MKAAIYCHCDTERELTQLREYCWRQDWRIAGEYIDDEWSEREAFKQLLAAADRHEFNLVLLWELAGLPHQTLDEVFSYVHGWWRQHIAFRSLTEPLFRTGADPAGQAFATIASALADACWEDECIETDCRHNRA